MRNILKAMLLLVCLSGFSMAVAQESMAEPVVQDQPVSEGGVEAPKAKKKGGFTLFLIVFLVAVLFVLSSATALKRMGGKPPLRVKTPPPNRRGKLPEGDKRFRL